MSRRGVQFEPSSASETGTNNNALSQLQQLQQQASGHASEEDTEFIATSTALLRGPEELRNPLFVPVRKIVDMMKLNEEVKRHQLEEHSQKLTEVNHCLKSYVQRHYDSFNDSIAYFSELIRKISEAQTCVATSHVDLSNVQGLFQCRALELESHFRRAAKSILVKRILRNVAEAARGERQVDALISQRKFVDAARTFNRCREIVSLPTIQRMSSGITSLTFFTQRSSEMIRTKTFEFLLSVVFLKHEAEDSQLMARALARSSTLAFASSVNSSNNISGSGNNSNKKSSSSSGNSNNINDSRYQQYYLASCTRDSPLFIAVRQAIGAFKQLGALQDLPRMLCSVANSCVENYFNTLISQYAVFVHDDFSANEKQSGGGGGGGGDSSSDFGSSFLGGGSSSMNGGGTRTSLFTSTSSSASAVLIQMIKERRHLAQSQASAVAAFFKSALAQAATILCNLQRVVEIVLENELPLFPNAVIANQVWRAAILSEVVLTTTTASSGGNRSSSSSSIDWNVESCRMPPWLSQKFVIPQVVRLVRDDACQIDGEVLRAVEKLFGDGGSSSSSSNSNNMPMWLMIVTSGRYENFGVFLGRLLGAVREQLTTTVVATATTKKVVNNKVKNNDEEEEEHQEDQVQEVQEEEEALNPGTIGAIVGLIREHTIQTAKKAILDELLKFTRAWDMSPIWTNFQQLFVTMSRVLSGVPATGEITESNTKSSSNNNKNSKFLFDDNNNITSTSGGNQKADDDDDVAVATRNNEKSNKSNSSSGGMFDNDGRLGLERLSALLQKKERSIGFPKYIQDMGFVSVRVSNVADQLVAKLMLDEEAAAAQSNKNNNTKNDGGNRNNNNSNDRDNSNDNNNNPFENEEDPVTIPNFAVAAANSHLHQSSSSSSSGGRIPFPRVVSNLETALSHVIVPVAGNGLTIWICLEPFAALSKTLLCLSKAEVGAIFKELGTLVSKQLLVQAHNYWINQLSVLDLLSGGTGGGLTEGSKKASQLFLPDDKAFIHHSSGSSALAAARLSSVLSDSASGQHPPLSTTKEGVSSAFMTSQGSSALSYQAVVAASSRPLLELVSCAAQAVLGDYAALLSRAVGVSLTSSSSSSLLSAASSSSSAKTGGGKSSFFSSSSSKKTTSSSTGNNNNNNSNNSNSNNNARTPSSTAQATLIQSLDLTQNVVDKCITFTDTLLACLYSHLSELSSSPKSTKENQILSAAKRALLILTPTLNQGTEDEIYQTAKQQPTSTLYSYLDLQRTIEVPLTVLAGATELWEAVLDDLKQFDSDHHDLADLLHPDNLLSIISVSSIASLSYSLEWFASEILESKVLGPLVVASQNNGNNSNSSSPSTSQQQLQLMITQIERVVFKCRSFSRCCTMMLGVNLLTLILCKVNDLRNDAAYKVETCNQRPSVFASELVQEIHANFSVIFAHLDSSSSLWLVSLLPQPIASLLLSESVKIRDKRFSTAGVDQFIYDVLALESCIKSLVMVSSCSSSSSSSSVASCGGGGGSSSSNNNNNDGGEGASSSSSSSMALLNHEEIPAYLELVSKPFSKPLEFFRLLRRGNDVERAKCLEDILARNLYPKFSFAELETLLGLVFREYKHNSEQFLDEQRRKLSTYVTSTFHETSKNNKSATTDKNAGSVSSSSLSNNNKDPEFSSLLSRASALFGDVSGSTLMMMPANKKKMATQQEETPGAAAKTLTANTPAVASTPSTQQIGGVPPPSQKKGDDDDRNSSSEDEEEWEEEEEEEEQEPNNNNNNNHKKNNKTTSSKLSSLLYKQTENNTNNNIPPTPASTILFNDNNTPADGTASRMQQQQPSPSPANPQAAAATTGGPLDDHQSEEFDEEEEWEEEEEEEDESPPPPPSSAPPPTTGSSSSAAAAAAAAPAKTAAMTLREKLLAKAKK